MQNYNVSKLKNGFKLITASMKGTNTITLLLIVGTGSKYETRDNNGISHFLEHMFFKGTKKRPTALKLSSELDSLGAEYNAFTAKEYTGYWIKVEAGKIKKALDIISDMFFNTKLDAKEIEREKGVIVEEINMYNDNPMIYIEDVFEECLYGDTPAGWDTAGSKENVCRFRRKDFTDYLKSQYCAHNTFVCLVGNMGSNQKNMSNLVNKNFFSEDYLSREKSFQEKKPVKENQTKPQIKIYYKKTDQAHLSLGVRTFGYDHKDRLAAKMISIILGGSMSSRLFINLRERNGLAYYVRTESEFYSDAGYLTTRAGVPVDKMGQAIKIIINEYKKIREKQVDKQELKRAKDLLQGRVTIQLEASDNMANWFGRQAVLLNTIQRTNKKNQDKIIEPNEYFKKINQINLKEMKRVASQIFVNQGLNLAVIGPYKDKNKFNNLLKL